MVSLFQCLVEVAHVVVDDRRIPLAPDSRAGAQADGSRRTRAGLMSESAGRISHQGVTFKALLTKAYRLGPDQISGPAWIDSNLFSVTAIVPEAAPAEDVEAIGTYAKRCG